MPEDLADKLKASVQAQAKVISAERAIAPEPPEFTAEEAADVQPAHRST